MGFFDSYKKSFEAESQRSAKRQSESTYRTLAQQERDHFNSLDSQNDSTLLRKMKDGFVPDKDKEIIDKILKSRGYKKATNGTYHRL